MIKIINTDSIFSKIESYKQLAMTDSKYREGINFSIDDLEFIEKALLSKLIIQSGNKYSVVSKNYTLLETDSEIEEHINTIVNKGNELLLQQEKLDSEITHFNMEKQRQEEKIYNFKNTIKDILCRYWNELSNERKMNKKDMLAKTEKMISLINIYLNYSD